MVPTGEKVAHPCDRERRHFEATEVTLLARHLVLFAGSVGTEYIEQSAVVTFRCCELSSDGERLFTL